MKRKPNFSSQPRHITSSLNNFLPLQFMIKIKIYYKMWLADSDQVFKLLNIVSYQ